MADKEKYTILYGRLSQEDEREGESNSIQNQRLILTAYAEDKAFENLKFLYDDGYSGTNFNRPAWNEIMTLIESLSGFDICLYTGFEMDEVPNELVEKLTYIKVGKFVKSLQTSTKPYVGSSNQKFIKLKELEK